MPTLILDTNAIRGARSGQLEELAKLARARLIRIVVPEVVCEELRTQVREAAKSLAENKGEVLKPGILGEKSKALINQGFEVVSELCDDAKTKELLDAWLSDYAFEREALVEDDFRAALADYFSGNPPFGEVKEKDKNSMPDALIFQTATRLALSANAQCILVTNDKAILRAATEQELFSVRKTIRDFMEDPIARQLLNLELKIGAEIHTEEFEQNFDEAIEDRVWAYLERFDSELAQLYRDIVEKEGVDSEYLSYPIEVVGLPYGAEFVSARALGKPSNIEVSPAEWFGGTFTTRRVEYVVKCEFTFEKRTAGELYGEDEVIYMRDRSFFRRESEVRPIRVSSEIRISPDVSDLLKDSLDEFVLPKAEFEVRATLNFD